MSDMMFVEMEYTEDGVLKPECLERMDLEQIQDLVDTLNLSMSLDKKNLDILRAARNQKAFDRMEELKSDSFTEGSHTYTKSTKTEVCGDLLAMGYPVIWKELTSKYRAMFRISTKNMDDYLKGKGANPDQRKRILDDIKVPLDPEVRVTKR